jgi:hypothetical protein
VACRDIVAGSREKLGIAENLQPAFFAPVPCLVRNQGETSGAIIDVGFKYQSIIIRHLA